MKELPYFRFTVAEWLEGDINLESYKHKGLFIDLCAYYWFKDCSLSKQKLSKRFPNDEQLLLDLIEAEIIKINNENQVEINFLDEQYQKACKLSSIRSKCGKMKGLQKKQKLSKSKAKAEQKHIYKDKDKDNDNSNFLDDSFSFKASEYLYKLILKRNPTHKKPDLQSWAKSIDLMLRVDKRTKKDIRDVIYWSQNDNFWSTNILSTSKLRKQFDQLFVKMQQNPIKSNNESTIDPNRPF